MAAPTRIARLLSPRLQCLHQPPTPVFRQAQIRCLSSRYSNPSKRGLSSAPAQPSSFLEQAHSYDNQSSDAQKVKDPRQAHEEHRRYHLNRMRFAGMGLLLSMGGLALVVSMIDLDELEQSAEKKRRSESSSSSSGSLKLDASDSSNATFQGKEVHVVGAGADKRIVAQGAGQDIELVETGTSSVPHFPRTIYLPISPGSASVEGAAQPNEPENPGNLYNQEEYTLIGCGIRTVMWIQVYVVGLYIRTTDISALQEKLIHSVNPIASTLVPAEKEGLRTKLLDGKESRVLWDELLQVPGMKTAWRVSPTRNTDFGHLRDGFVTGIGKRTEEARQLQRSQGPPGVESEYDSESFGQAIQTFKGVFAKGKAPKASILLMARDQSGAMDVLYQAKPDGSGVEKGIETLGSVPDERVSRLIWLNYLAGDKVSSEPARKGVVDGLVTFASRPIGSVESRVV